MGVVAARGGLVLKHGLLRAHFGRLEDGLGFDLFELGLEVFGALGQGRRIGPTARVGHGVLRHVLYLVAGKPPVVRSSQPCHCEMTAIDLPVALASTILLDFVRVRVDRSSLGEVLGERAILGAGILGVVFVAELVGASHW